MINHSHTIVQLSSDTTVSMMLPIGYRLLLYTQQVSLKVDMFKAAKVQGVLVPYIAGLTIQTPPFWPPWVTAAQVALWQSFTTTLPSTPSGSRHRARASTGKQISKNMRLEIKYLSNKQKQTNKHATWSRGAVWSTYAPSMGIRDVATGHRAAPVPHHLVLGRSLKFSQKPISVLTPLPGLSPDTWHTWCRSGPGRWRGRCRETPPRLAPPPSHTLALAILSEDINRQLIIG